MLIKLIFRRFNLKENKYLMAAVYGFLYFLFTLMIFALASMFIKTNIIRDIIFSLIIGLIMSVVYLIKVEMFKLIGQRNKK
jgi:hypothetical protein